MATKRPRQETKNSRRRTCLGCGRVDDQAALLRMRIREDGELEISQQGEGRSGYLHTAEACWQLFIRKKGVYRAFHKEIDHAARERLVLALRGRG